MKFKITTLAVVVAMAAAAPAYAQIVNGTNGTDTAGPAPVGTKAGGSANSAQAPGEAVASDAAVANEAESKTGQSPTQTAAHKSRHHAASSMSSGN